MKQTLQSYKSGELWLAEVPEPACLSNGVKVKVHASLVSAGTERRMIELAKASLLQKAMKRPDQVRRIIQKIKTEGLLSTWQQVNAKLETPVPLGYSVAGVVTEVGIQAAGEFSLGQRVACAGVGYANHAEVVTAPKTLVVSMPDALSFEHGCFGALGAIAMQAVRQAEPQVGEVIGVIGLGLLGNLVSQILAVSGARVVGTDLDPAKQKLVLECGVDAAGNDIMALMNQVAPGRGLDKIIIAAASSDSKIIHSCPPALRHRGRIVILGFVGMDCPHQEFYNKELDLRMSMSYGPGRYDPRYEEGALDYPYAFVRWTEQRNIEAFLQLVAHRKVKLDPLISHRFEFDNALQAYKLLQSQQPYLGIVLNYSANQPAARMVRLRRGGDTLPAVQGTKLAVIGAGGFASGVLGPILKELKVPVHSVVTNRGLSAISSAKRLDAELAATELDLALKEPSVTHVLIATRHASHASQAEASLRAGKITHVEKPLCTNREQLARIKAVVAETKGEDRVLVGFNRRFSPLSALLVSEIRAQPAEPIMITYRINAGVLPNDHWFFDDPGGRVTAEGCHFIDYCIFLTGKPVRSVACSKQGVRGRAFDSFAVTMDFDDGSIASVVYSGQGDRALSKERIEVYQHGTCWINDDWSSLVRYREGKRTKLYSGRQSKGWREEMEHFLGVRRSDSAPHWDEIVAVHECLFDAIDSALGRASESE